MSDKLEKLIKTIKEHNEELKKKRDRRNEGKLGETIEGAGPNKAMRAWDKKARVSNPDQVKNAQKKMKEYAKTPEGAGKSLKDADPEKFAQLKNQYEAKKSAQEEGEQLIKHENGQWELLEKSVRKPVKNWSGFSDEGSAKPKKHQGGDPRHFWDRNSSYTRAGNERDDPAKPWTSGISRLREKAPWRQINPNDRYKDESKHDYHDYKGIKLPDNHLQDSMANAKSINHKPNTQGHLYHKSFLDRGFKPLRHHEGEFGYTTLYHNPSTKQYEVAYVDNHEGPNDVHKPKNQSLANLHFDELARHDMWRSKK